MLRILFVFIMAVHGIIHILGFLKAFDLTKIEELKKPISKPIGVLWLIATIFFLASSLFYILNMQWWWLFAGISVILSQFLVLTHWQDAKFGTMANIIILIPCAIGMYTWDFDKSVHKELQALLPQKKVVVPALIPKQVNKLPVIIKKWLVRSKSVGKPIIKTALIEQKGTMKTSPSAKWMPFRATQWIATEKPGFLWRSKIDMGFGIHLLGRDLYFEGKGKLFFKLLSLVPIVNAKGDKIDQGTLLRYLAEIVWVPSAAASPYIKWKSLAPLKAQATMSYKGVTASGVFTFTKKGDPLRFQAKRYYSRRSGPTLEDWLVEVDPKGYKVFDGIRLPAKAKIIWKLKKKNFHWYNVTIEKAHFNF